MLSGQEFDSQKLLKPFSCAKISYLVLKLAFSFLLSFNLTRKKSSLSLSMLKYLLEAYLITKMDSAPYVS